MGLNIGLNARRDDRLLGVSLDADALTSAVVIHCLLDQARIKAMAPDTHWLWLGDTTLVLTDTEASRIQDFIDHAVDGEACS
jgi:hypothetical protein